MTTTANPIPDAPLPAGAVWASEWQDWDGDVFRGFRGSDRVILDGKGEKVAEIRTTGTQLSDGSVDNNDEEHPAVDIYVYRDAGLGSARARELAAALLEAADEMDSWVTR